jgi:hypothetical protein
MSSIFRRLCCCFCPKPPSKKQRLLNKAASANEDNSSSTELEDVIINNNTNTNTTTTTTNNDTVSLFSEEYYTETERKIINFTKSKIIEIINNEFNNPSKLSSYKQFYNQNGLNLSCNTNGSDLNTTIQMVKMSYTIPKQTFPPNITIPQIADAMNNEAHRLQWDTSLKEYKILSKHNTFYIIYTRMSKPMAFVSERDLLEKKTEFYHEGAFYSFCSSFINNTIKSDVDDVQRIVNYFSGFKISEDTNNFYFNSLNQIDYKMSLPQSILNVALPTSLIKWYTSLNKYLHSKYNV